MRIFLLCLLVACGFVGRAQEKKAWIMVDGLKRDFVTYLPAGFNGKDNLPVIISLHGRLGTASGQLKFADFRPVADREKIIIVCPQGVDRSWNDGRSGTPANSKGIDDVVFIDSLINYTVRTYNADNTRIYVTGMSNGGFMASRLAIDLNRRIAAVAVVGASMSLNTGFEPGLTMPIMYIQGTKDPLVPFEGGTMKKGAGGDIYGHEQVLQKWAAADSCLATPVMTHLPVINEDGTSVIREEFQNPNGLEVIGYTIVGGGHTWPEGSQYLPKAMIGTVSHNLDACEIIWDFFRHYRHTFVEYPYK